MIASRLSMLRPSLRAAFRPTGRRGYTPPSHASRQERIGLSSDRPWQIAALAVTVPGVMYLRKGNTLPPSASGSGSPGKPRMLHTESAKKGLKVESKKQTAANASSSSSGGASTPSAV